MKTGILAVLVSMLACLFFTLPVAAGTDAEKSAEHGTVIFYRTRSAKGGAIGLNITGGDKGTVGVLKNGSKIVKDMPVGEFTFVVNSPSIAGQDSVTINVKAGKTYYVKGATKWGWPAARPGFTLMDEKKGKAESDKIK
jgi:hypothetical protein